MKKLIFIALLSFTSLIGYSNQLNDTLPSKIPENVLKTVSDSSTLTFKEVYSDVKEGLKGLAGALKVGTEHVYEILVKQQTIDAYLFLIILIPSLLLLIFSIIKLLNLGWRDNTYYESNWKDYGGYKAFLKTQYSSKNTIFIILTICSFILTLVGISNLDTIISGLLNPEYGAIKDIMNFINK